MYIQINKNTKEVESTFYEMPEGMSEYGLSCIFKIEKEIELGNGKFFYIEDRLLEIKKPQGLNLVFNYEKMEWTETATEEDFFKQKVVFYNKELEFASKASVELVCGIITEDVFEEVKDYMKSIDPYAEIKTIPEVKRPEIFKKYL